MQAPQKSDHHPERRTGPETRRKHTQDRRNEDRVAEELEPRRNPDIPDRRL
ncbi:MAG: hypothetical protein AAF993_19080 [Pseudomonadota bacterium]